MALAEYLGTTVVLDVQLVQSDGVRMEWFRQLLADKARQFQVLVFTCRPTDYLVKAAMAPAKGPLFLDSEDGMTRAFNLGRVLA